MSNNASVCRKINAIAGAIADDRTQEALCGYCPKVIAGDFAPLTKRDAVKSVVSYMKDLSGVSTRVNSYKKGLVTIYLGDIKILVQVNTREGGIFSEKVVVIKITGRDIEHGKLSRAVGSKVLNQIWLSAPAKKRIALAKKNGV